MYDVIVEQDIASAHQLAGYKGKCEKLHGHNWKIQLELTRDSLDEIGLAMDFTEVKKIFHALLERFDHVKLNDLPEFSAINPTSENLARVIYQECSKAFSAYPVRMRSVVVWESARASVRYYE